MGSVVIRQTFRVNNVPTDVTSFVLSNPGGTAGVIRNDTAAVVVADGTAMTWVATGTYEYTFTSPANGLEYTAYYEITAADGTVYNLQDTLRDTSSPETALPALTGDTLQDTLDALLRERLEISRNGPKPTYSLHGHMVAWNVYLKYLDERILALRREIAQMNPFEEQGIGL